MTHRLDRIGSDIATDNTIEVDTAGNRYEVEIRNVMYYWVCMCGERSVNFMKIKTVKDNYQLHLRVSNAL